MTNENNNEPNKTELLKTIELKRAEMNAIIEVAISNGEPLSNDKIVKASQELDLLVNRYNELIGLKNLKKDDDIV